MNKKSDLIYGIIKENNICNEANIYFCKSAAKLELLSQQCWPFLHETIGII